MQDRALNNPKIEFVWNKTIEDILDGGTGAVNGIRLKDTKTGAQSELACDGVFIAIGHKPNTELFQGQLDMDETGYLKAENTRTKLRGVFACGDVQDKVYRQAITAAGSGCMAAIEAERLLEAEEAGVKA